MFGENGIMTRVDREILYDEVLEGDPFAMKAQCEYEFRSRDYNAENKTTKYAFDDCDKALDIRLNPTVWK